MLRSKGMIEWIHWKATDAELRELIILVVCYRAYNAYYGRMNLLHPVFDIEEGANEFNRLLPFYPCLAVFDQL